MSKFKVGDKVWCNGDVRIIKRVDEWANGEYGYYFNVDDDLLDFWEEEDLELYKTPHQRLLDLGFEKVAKHKYIKRDKGDIGYIIIAFAFNSYHIKCVGKNWVEVNFELAEVLLEYLEELEND